MLAFKETREKEFLLAESLAWVSENVSGAEILLSDPMKQGIIGCKHECLIKGKGHIVFDFGREYFGGIRLLFNTNRYDGDRPNIRIRFGESLSECMADLGEKNTTNDHSTRDFCVYMSSNSDMEWGSTGYRYVHIEFIEDGIYRLSNVFGTFIHTDAPCGMFECDNAHVNEIFSVAARTIWLNLQNECIWDGIKRDQHVWVGDLFPEILSVLYLYGDSKSITNSLDWIVKYYPMPCWYNDIPTYSIWFMAVCCMYFEKVGRTEEKYLQVFDGILEQIEEVVTDNGEIDYKKSGLTYWEPLFDWPSFGSKDSDDGCEYLLRYTLQQVEKNRLISDQKIKDRAKSILKRLKKESKPVSAFKAITAFGVLCGKINKDKGIEMLLNGGARGYSSFMNYFILKALSENGEVKAAFEDMMTYYSGMIKRGATTFWESFDIDWMENSCGITELPKDGQKDIHGDFGANCYQGFRHSLCHGWSCGVIPFIIENIVGFSYVDELCTKVRFLPNLCGLKFIRCKIPTARGIIEAEFKEEGGTIKQKISCCEGIELCE